jgi:tetratricopeptide (TPR) repeat protein
MELERQILGVEREGDIPGEMIPYVYFEYLRNREAHRLVPIFHHNAIDILTLACLTDIVPCAFRSPEDVSLQHGTELLGVARWLRQSDRLEQAAGLMRRAIDADLPDDLLFRTLWDLGLLEKKLGRVSAALTLFTDLSTCRNPHQIGALEELAKHYEHREKDHAMALECTRNAIHIEDTPELRHREQRLEKKLSKPRNRKLI